MIVPLHEIAEKDAPHFGPKVMGLVRLARRGLAVPRGFCISGSAYRDHVGSIGELIEKFLSHGGDADASLFDKLNQAITSKPMASELRALLEKHWRDLRASSVAVRSSAVTEDLKDHSSAGLYDTVLKVEEILDCVNAVLQCWASFWTKRAVEYRRRRGIPHDGNMAVIVQEQVKADCAGIAFAVEPVSGNPRVVVIEACEGTGDALASGRVTPERVIVRKRDKKIVLRQLPKGRRSVLSRKTALRIARAVCLVESSLGGDLEWAVRKGKVFFLQARPITAVTPWDPSRAKIWSNANVGEVVPGVISPLGWSLAKLFVKGLFNDNLAKLGIDLGTEPLIHVIAGRAYFELTMLSAILRSVPGMSKMEVNTIFGGHQEHLMRGRPIIPDETAAPMRIYWPRLVLMTPLFLLRGFLLCGWESRDLLDRLRKRGRDLQRLDPRAFGEKELLKRARHIVDTLFEVTGAFESVAVGMAYLNNFILACRRWLGDEGGVLANRLLAGTGAIDSAEPGLALWRMAAHIRNLGDLEAVVKNAGSFAQLRALCKDTPAGRDFLREWDAFMEAHGHHAQGEVDIAEPRWSERPDYILDIVRSYLSGLDAIDPVASHRTLASEREALLGECLTRLAGPLKRAAFRFLHRKAAWGLAQREAIKSEAIRQMAVIRHVLQELGARLAMRGVLEQGDDVFSLTLEQLDQVLKIPPTVDVREIIEKQKTLHARNLALNPPPVIFGTFDEAAPPAIPELPGGETLAGQSVSAGKAEGPARVIMKRGEEQAVQPGEILVIPYADPGWTPYFMPAAGIVMDMGGMLSHGCIIARELGIPTVVNVGPATSLITTGRIVRVDADRGIVTILE